MSLVPPAVVLAVICANVVMASVTSPVEFAATQGLVPGLEQPFRQEICLNGLWQFQPVDLPKGYQRDTGVPPELPAPVNDGWSKTPIKVPSHWNVNTWGGGRIGRRPDKQFYWPDSVYYPSYPADWDHKEMGWLRRSFCVPETWRAGRVLLHFEAVAGECQVMLNGKNLKEHFDNFLPFDIDVTDSLKWDGENELLVGIRSQNLFNKRSPQYKKFLSPYPPGSALDSLVGIWQDVFLIYVPAVRVADTFVKPDVSHGSLEVEVALVNEGPDEQTVELSGEVCPWVNLAPKDQPSAPPQWKIGDKVLTLPSEKVVLKAGEKKAVTFRQPVKGQLKLWSPRSPELYGFVLTLSDSGKIIDRKYTRFGWREITIRGSDILVNGEKTKAMGDFVHPFGAYIMSPGYVRTWYQMIKDVGGNAVRPHAQVHPKFYLEIADEMGLLVLAETSVFGSSIRLNPDEPDFWKRYADHYDGMVLRDRNHPSVMGWSFGNEMFAIPRLNEMKEEDTRNYYGKLKEIAGRSRALDPTRTFITCDGDEDLEGLLPVWSKHFGHGDFVSKLPHGLDKPLVVGESGGTYYATPEQLSEFNGERAFESYTGRNEALAIDLYENIVNMALPYLAYFSPSILGWYGFEHLNLGYDDFSRMPTEEDGVFFRQAFVEGKPGMQPERIPPYVTTFNPGWDKALPLYKPLPMFAAMKAALAPGGPQPIPWSRKEKTASSKARAVAPTIEKVGFIGPQDSALRKQMISWGVPVTDKPSQDVKLLVVDGQSLDAADITDARSAVQSVLANGGAVLVMVRDKQAPLEKINSLLPEPVALTERKSTLLVPDGKQPMAAGFALSNLNFSQGRGDALEVDAKGDPQIIKCGLDGSFARKGEVALQASNTDWSLFNNVPEKAKASAVQLYERLQKPSGAAFVQMKSGGGTLAVSSLDYLIDSRIARAMWTRLFGNMGVKLGDASADSAGASGPAGQHDLLLNGPLDSK